MPLLSENFIIQAAIVFFLAAIIRFVNVDLLIVIGKLKWFPALKISQ